MSVKLGLSQREMSRQLVFTEVSVVVISPPAKEGAGDRYNLGGK